MHILLRYLEFPCLDLWTDNDLVNAFLSRTPGQEQVVKNSECKHLR